jgi:hypothetical protein
MRVVIRSSGIQMRLMGLIGPICAWFVNSKRRTADAQQTARNSQLVTLQLSTRDDLQFFRGNLKLDRGEAGYIAVQL